MMPGGGDHLPLPEGAAPSLMGGALSSSLTGVRRASPRLGGGSARLGPVGIPAVGRLRLIGEDDSTGSLLMMQLS
jgi:hypothetical protein